MSLSLAQREEIAALLRERRLAQDIEHSQLAQHSGKTPAAVRKILRGEPQTLHEYQLLAVPLGIEMKEIEEIMGGRAAVSTARATIITAVEEEIDTLEIPLEEERELPTALVIGKEHLAERIRAVMERHEVDVAKLAQLASVTQEEVERALEAQVEELSTYNRLLEILLSPAAPKADPEIKRIPSVRRVISAPDTLSKRERKRLGNELRAQIKKTSMTYDQFAEHLGHDVSWLRSLLLGLAVESEVYQEVRDAIDELLDTPDPETSTSPPHAAFEVLGTRLLGALAGRTRASVGEALGLPTSAITYAIRGNSKSLERYALIGEYLGLPDVWIEVAWQAPAPPPVKVKEVAPVLSQEEKERLGQELRARTKASGWSQRAVAQHVGRSLAWLTSVFRAKTKNASSYEAVAQALDELGSKSKDEASPEERHERGQAFKARLKSTRMTQRAFSERIGKSTSWLAQFFRGDISGAESRETVTQALAEVEAELREVATVPQEAPRARRGSPEDCVALGAALKSSLNECNVTQATLAQSLGKSQSWLSRVLLGKARTLAHYELVEEALGGLTMQTPTPAPPAQVDLLEQAMTPAPSRELDTQLDALENAIEALSEVIEGWSAASQPTQFVSLEQTQTGQILGFRSDGRVFVLEEKGIFQANEFSLPTHEVSEFWPNRGVSRDGVT